MPKVSVIIPTFNRAQSVGKAINSVLKQTYQDFETIVVDDGSTDNTKLTVDSYGNSVKYLYQANSGAGSARNTGISNSTGEYIAFLDSDDFFAEQNLEKKISILEEQLQIGWIYSDWQFVDEQGAFLKKGSVQHDYSKKRLSGNIFAELFYKRNFITPSTVIVRRSVLDHVGYFDPMIPSQEEYDLWLRISAKYSIHYIDEILVFRTIHGAMLSSDFGKWAHGNALIIDKMETILPNNFSVSRFVLRRMHADKYTFLGRDYIERGQYRRALSAYWTSVIRFPFQKRIYWLMCSAVIRTIMRYFYHSATSENGGS
jgi:glycosyltransferase involved in cell wall biosynthesis